MALAVPGLARLAGIMQFHVVPKYHEVTQVLEEQIDEMSGTSCVPHDNLLRLIEKKIGHH